MLIIVMLFYNTTQAIESSSDHPEHSSKAHNRPSLYRDPISPLLLDLYRLPVAKRALFEILILWFKAQNYVLSTLVRQYTPKRNLKSTSQCLLSVLYAY